MKRLLLVALTLISISAQSQTWAKVYIWKVTPDTAFLGDTVTVDFKFDEPLQNPKIDTTFMQFMDAVGAFTYVWKDKWQNIYSYPKKEVGFQDSVYQVKVRVPLTLRPGDCRVYGRGGSFQNVYTKVKTATAVLLNRSEQKVKETRYYNLLGAELPEAVTGVRLIRVTVYEDGSTESKLIVML